MKVSYKNYQPKEGIEFPYFYTAGQNQLSDMNQELPIKTIKCLRVDYKLSHMESKYTTTRINESQNQPDCQSCLKR